MGIRDLFKGRKAKAKAKAEKGRVGALAIPDPTTTKPADPAGWWFDPLSMGFRFGGDVPDPTHPGTLGLSYDVLGSMARVDLIAPIIKRRVDQVAEFCRPQANPYSIGYRVKLRDPKGKATRASDKRAHEISRLLQVAGGHHGDAGLEMFARAYIRDSLVLDQGVFEVLHTRGLGALRGRPYGMKALDATTFRLAKPPPAAMGRGHLKPDEVKYLQLLQGKVVREFSRDEIAWGIRHPRTSVHTWGYGNPELAELTRVLTSLLNATAYNDANFTNGIHISTILAVKSAMEPSTFRAFQTYVRALMTGPRNAKKTPFIKLDPDKNEDIKAINLSQTNKEMEFKEHINFKIKICCALFGIDPAEIGFVFGTEGVSSTLSSAGPRDRLNYSKESGLRPLVRFFEAQLNTHVVRQLDDDFCVELAGMDSVTEQEKIELHVKEVQHWKTVNEVRSEHDLQPIDGPGGDLILNAQFTQIVQGAMAEEGEGPEGPEGPPPPGGDMGRGGGGDVGDDDDDGLRSFFDGGDAPPGVPTDNAQKSVSGLQRIDRATTAMAKSVERSIDSGRMVPVKGKGYPRGKWGLVEDKPGVRAWVVEV